MWVFVSNSPRKTASKRSLLLTPVQRGLSRGTLCQKPSTPLKVKCSLCLVNLSSPPAPTLSWFSRLLLFRSILLLPSWPSPCLHGIAYHPHLPPPAPYLPSLPHALAGLFAPSKNKQHTTKEVGCLHIDILCVKPLLLLPGDSQWQPCAKENSGQ